jgi:hypothetical protein
MQDTHESHLLLPGRSKKLVRFVGLIVVMVAVYLSSAY